METNPILFNFLRDQCRKLLMWALEIERFFMHFQVKFVSEDFTVYSNTTSFYPWRTSLVNILSGTDRSRCLDGYINEVSPGNRQHFTAFWPTIKHQGWTALLSSLSDRQIDTWQKRCACEQLVAPLNIMFGRDHNNEASGNWSFLSLSDRRITVTDTISPIYPKVVYFFLLLMLENK